MSQEPGPDTDTLSLSLLILMDIEEYWSEWRCLQSPDTTTPNTLTSRSSTTILILTEIPSHLVTQLVGKYRP